MSSSTPISIVPSPTELKHGRISQRNLEIAIRALARDGLVVIEAMVDHSILDRLNAKMVHDAYKLQASKDSPFNYNKGNIQQDPPLTEEWFSDDIFINPMVTQVTSTALGPKPSLRFVSGNTALPPTETTPPTSQPTHNDADFDHPNIPFALVVNVPLVTMTPENGSTEIWLGTHNGTTIADQEGEHGDRASGRIKKHLLEARKEVRPPSQPVVKKGSIIIRDLRLWHGGKPNLSTEPRVMLAMIHFAPWYRNSMDVEFAEELADRLTPEKTGLHIAATFVTNEQLLKNYLHRPFGNAYDFNQTDRIEGMF
ncbi:phytanoyl-CoA dioxygenase family protein [Cucurbitaria berberidis CBS 394.84]|uniref:Phytanoyl-CoA dioxygenase family protein n=1 Tax=Cucurbitaria berberidis CBS 394.84 TaxID=1168544 RepID=A0A9P4GHY3_9PLEO|nr:phytanoyl-CoA dioxygenase family protein [Cucurbitaria berberidis CBS 394.84]KAF1846498.1 phytanoyl-CoA dioxygenase family protein [Cucurbitaria berberidis CBS 394.84]